MRIKNKSIKNASNQTALFVAAENNKPKAVSALLDVHAVLDTQDTLGRTPLYIAIYKKNVDVAKLLVQAGANPNIKNKNGKSPKILAKSMGLTEVFNVEKKPNAKKSNTNTKKNKKKR